jgi:hypothetical protein
MRKKNQVRLLCRHAFSSFAVAGGYAIVRSLIEPGSVLLSVGDFQKTPFPVFVVPPPRFMPE